MNIKIKEGIIEDILKLSPLIPELDTKIDQAEIAKRFYNKDFVILVIYLNGKPAGFKAGYDRYGDGSFYSWLGGVLPEFRRKGLGRMLMKRLHSRVKDKGFAGIRMKTKEQFAGMLALALSEGYEMNGKSKSGKILLEKRIR